MKKNKLVLIVLISILIQGFSANFATAATNTGPTKNLGTVASESYWYSRYYLGNTVMMSGMGLHMVYNPSFMGNLTMMMMKIDSAAKLTTGGPAINAWVIFAEFASATPKYAQPVDVINSARNFTTLRWDFTGADKDLYPAVLGQAGLKNVLWAEDFLGANHYIINGTRTQLPPDTSPMLNYTQAGATIALGLGPVSGMDWNTDGFRGFVLTAEVINKMKLLKGMIAVNISSGMLDMGLDPMTDASTHYFPHRYTYDIDNTFIPDGGMMPMPKPENYSVVDTTSTLWDQLSLLWMSARFHGWSADSAQDDVFNGTGMGQQPFPGNMIQTGMPGPEDLSKGLSMTVWSTLLNHHWNSVSKTFVDNSTYSPGTLTPGNIITTIDAGLTIAALEEWSSVTMNMLGQNTYIADQADFLITKLQDPTDGGFENSYDLSASLVSTSARTLETQAGAIRGLLAAYKVTNDAKYKTAALLAFNFMERQLWDDNNRVYKSSEGATIYVYTPKSIGAVVGALREVMALNNATIKPISHFRLVQFFEEAVDKSGFQQSEADATGGQADGDGIPAPPMQTANGATDGTAPMPAGLIQLNSATGIWSIIDYTYYTDLGMYAANEFMFTGWLSSFYTGYTFPAETYQEAIEKFYGTPTTPAAIPGFDLAIIIGSIMGITAVYIFLKRRRR